MSLGDRTYWNASRPRMVEYAMQESQVLRASELPGVMEAIFGLKLHRVTLAKHLAELVAEGRVVRLRHGLYAHVSSVYA
jgi:hypothetical protein